MSIVFRNVKGSALTYTEMDRNQAQFFYSASVASNALQLHYTGSSVLNSEGQTDYEPRYVEVPLGSGGSSLNLTQGTGISITLNSQGQTVITNTGTASPGGLDTNIQFNDNGSFGGDNLFVYDKAQDFVGIGITSGMTRRLHINDTATGGAIIRLQANPLNQNGTKLAYLETGNYTGTSTRIGKVNPNSDNTYIHQIHDIQRTHFSFVNTSSITATVSNVGIGIGTQSPNRDLSIKSNSNKGIGIFEGDGRGVENRIRILPNVWQKTFVNNDGDELEGINRYGLGIHTPITDSSDGGNMLIAVSDNRDGINENRDPNRLLITAYDVDVNDDSLEGTPVHIASFTAAGRVGIHTPDPNQEIRLDINGQYRGAYTTTSEIAKLDFKNYSVIKFIPRQGFGGPYYLQDTIIPPEGTKAVLILGTNTVKYEVSFSNDGNLITGGNIGTFENRHSTITFVSDGTNLIETSRTVNMS